MAAGRGHAGSASGTLHFGLAAVANAVAGVLHDGSTLTMCAPMLACAVASLLFAGVAATSTVMLEGDCREPAT